MDYVEGSPEIWRDVVDFEGLYQVSSYGRVKSLSRYVPVNKTDGTVMSRLVNERIMKEKKDKYGFSLVGVSLETEVTTKYIHDFVVGAFFNGELFLEHKDSDVANNCVWNLRTIKEHNCIFNLEGKLEEKDLTQELLTQLFDYKDDGYLVWKLRPPEHFKALSYYRCFKTESYGKVAGYYNKRIDSKREDFGYWRVGITLGHTVSHFKLHRLIFLLHKGYLPIVVDHKDGDQTNNKIENLREGTHKNNSYNLRTPVNNTTGYKGVTKSSCPKRARIPYKASIEFDGYCFGLGSYANKDEAACAYNLAAKLLFKDFARLNETPFEVTSFVRRGKFFLKDYPEIENDTFDWSSKTKRKVRGGDKL